VGSDLGAELQTDIHAIPLESILNIDKNEGHGLKLKYLWLNDVEKDSLRMTQDRIAETCLMGQRRFQQTGVWSFNKTQPKTE
jgi:hypothetical protein